MWRRRALATALALVLGIAGCGGDDRSTPSSSTADTTATSSSAASTTGPSPPSSTDGLGTTTTGPRATSTTTSSAPSTSATSTTTTAPSRTPASALGFGEIAFTIGSAGYCALLADTDQQRSRGMMGRRDLAGYDAMVFRFPSDSTGAFYMRNVPVGLSIAWFASDGRFVSATDMAPCPDQEGCPLYSPAGPYRFAIEVLQGGLGRLGATDGSVLGLGGACTP